MGSISCKEAALLAEGAARGADWLCVTGEDNYVHTGRVEEFLRDKDRRPRRAWGTFSSPEEGRVLSRLRAVRGVRWALRRQRLHHQPRRLAPPPGRRRPGPPRGLRQQHVAERHDDQLPAPQARGAARDGRGSDMLGWPVFGIAEYERIARSGFLSAHYLRPDVMRWFHAEVEGAAESVKKQLEDKAFDHGCAVGMRTGPWAREWADCLASGGGRGPSWG
ncbi:unnamed protein product [Prorocentrum cordatum]|uniref:Uncharacterized protein n=1 Tax=Prorocentrum cordatum TaxID=2364126 RepID=A0ABN9VRE9_9DINO|nr:unnamed protein product [Polarella glacialis]